MKTKKIVALALSMAMIASIALTGCNKAEETTAGSMSGFYPPTQTTTVPEGGFEQVEVDKPEVPDGVPCVLEDMGGDTVSYVARGDDVQLSVEEANKANGMVLHCTNRMDTWNGVNFPCDELAGNSVRIQTAVKSGGGDVIISLQFDVMDSPTYSNLFHITDCKDEFVEGIGSTPIPETAKNVFIYVESGDVSDIYIDYMYITVEGEYADPSKVPELEIVDTSSYESLKELYKDDFMIGCCVPQTFITSEHDEPRQLVLQEFNSLTCENEMKPENVMDAQTTLADPAKYDECPALDFSRAQGIMDFAKENGLKMRGHTLIWHSQTPQWFFYEGYDTNGNLASRELMLKRMENYIKGVFEYINTNYPDLFYAFDVANECVDDQYNLRDSLWKQTIGDDYLQFAFEYARKYAPSNIKLFYNDYNEYYEKKMNKIIEVLKPIAEAGNLDGMGFQSHITIADAPVEKYAECVRKYSSELGVEIQVTELDVNAPALNADYEQALYYQKLFETLLALKAEGINITSVTIWGLTDAGSWRREQTPVLFRGDLSAKPAFQAVVNAKKGGEIEKPADYVEPPKEGDPIDENYEDDKISGGNRAGVTTMIVDKDAYEGSKCLFVTGATQTWDGYTIDVTRFIGKKIKYSFAVKSTADVLAFTADINDVWPRIEEIDTSSHDWVFVEGELDMTGASWTTQVGTYKIPELSVLKVYWESADVLDDFYLDAVHIELVE
ncbi:MAG: endo-1,4-beta-xylanase [Clostridiales bacterium]|nr:endo-1,4-beta-xylanase [Clostridiales bacterium]